MKKTSRFLLGSNLTIASGSLLSVLCATSCTKEEYSNINLEEVKEKFDKLDEKFPAMKHILSFSYGDFYDNWYEKIEKNIAEFKSDYSQPNPDKRYLSLLYDVTIKSINFHEHSIIIDNYIDLVQRYYKDIKKYPLLFDSIVYDWRKYRSFEEFDYVSCKKLEILDKVQKIKEVSVEKFFDWINNKSMSSANKIKAKVDDAIDKARKIRQPHTAEIIKILYGNFYERFYKTKIKTHREYRDAIICFGHLQSEIDRIVKRYNDWKQS
ncbi:hypothetical protein NPA07_04620 [Mycoplasmopsis caviae]|uniref:Uncharacterized protein n=1 Tax=Mycoplasmopsis caviae TaxID=55603 RepID=A0A3P8MFA2_9BACT|nr:hypothetical protein [Mycoplasmopsis caviae]UUD35061.1 hypothetical protein NPA07_04620 [Mycoplasmopsis caviae]VDR42113.1 Uncharacterised protein [Mycoplasmopsis caviae]